MMCHLRFPAIFPAILIILASNGSDMAIGFYVNLGDKCLSSQQAANNSELLDLRSLV